MNEIGPLEEHVLPQGIRARFVDNTNGLAMHVLEAGRPGAPLVVLLHGTTSARPSQHGAR
jgi:hypothetical protein